MGVEYEAMRVNLIEGLRVLAAGGSIRRPDGRQRWPGLTEGINWLDDNASGPAARWVGVTLRDAEEAVLIQRVHDAWTAVLRETRAEGGPLAGDATHMAAPSWPTVVAAASAALQHLEAATP